MADAIGITTGVVGTVAVTIHSIRALVDIAAQIREAPSTLEHLKNDLSITQTAFKQLQANLDANDVTAPGEVNRYLNLERINAYLNTCKDAFSDFEVKLQKWTARSTGAKLVWNDKWQFGYWNEKQVKGFQAKLGTCKATVTMVVTTLNSLSFANSIKDNKELYQQIIENQAETLASRMQGFQSDLSQIKEQLSSLRRAEESEDDAEERVGLHQQQSMLENIKAMCEDMRKKLLQEEGKGIVQEFTNAKITNSANAKKAVIDAEYRGGIVQRFTGTLIQDSEGAEMGTIKGRLIVDT